MTYDYECGCGKVTEVPGIRVDDRDICPTCECGGETHRIMSRSVHSQIDIFADYFDPNLVPQHSNSPGVHVKNKQHRKQLMRRLSVEESG